MRGEPGCSPSEFLFGESGIYHQRQNKQTRENDLIKNSHSWNEFTNLLVLDVPIGNGYSFLRGYENSERNYAKDQVIKDFIHFMKHFYLKFPRYRERDLYLAGIDFTAGMYLPYFAQAIEDVKQGKFEDNRFED
jgi:serine carboxypeptidase-like clade 2